MLTNIKIQGASNAEAIGLPRRRNAKAVMCIETGEIFASITDAAVFFNTTGSTISNVLNPNSHKSDINGYHLCFVSETMEHIDEITDARIEQNTKIADLTNGIINENILESGIIDKISTYITRIIRSNSQKSIDELKIFGIEAIKCDLKKVHHIKIYKSQSFALTIKMLKIDMFNIMDAIASKINEQLGAMSIYVERSDNYTLIISLHFDEFKHLGNSLKRYYRWDWYSSNDSIKDAYKVIIPSMLQGHNWRLQNVRTIKQLIVKEGVTCCCGVHDCKELVEVQLPESLETMGSNGWFDSSSFQECSSLKKINIPSGIDSIPYAMFRRCSSLTSITLPEKLHTIKDRAFSGCLQLNAINVPKTVMYIGDSAFMDCENLKEITLPNHLKTIEENTFYGCIRLHTITIPKSVKKIRTGAFKYCVSLKSVTVHRDCVIEEDAFSSTTKIKYYD